MIRTFNSDKPRTAKHFLKSWLISLFIVALPIVYDLLFPSNLIKDSYYFAVGGLLIARLFIDTSVNRLYQVTVDMEQRQILFLSKNLFSNSNPRILPFDDARLEVSKSKNQRSWLWEPITLYFLKNKMEVAEINRSKDGFSVDKLNEILKTIEQIPLPVKAT